MVPDMLHVESVKPTGKVRLRIKPRRLFNWLLGPRVVREIEVCVVRGWSNPYRKDKIENFIWRRKRRQDREIVLNV